MNVIYKYPLNIEGYPWVDLPEKHQICDIAVQNGKAFIWVLHEKDAEPNSRLELMIFGTGENLPPPDKIGDFLKTIHMPPFVWHIFDTKEGE